MLVAALLVVPAIAIEQSEAGDPWTTIALVINWATWLAFVTEAVLMLSVVDSRSRWLRDHPLEIAIILLTAPFLPASLQALRGFRAPAEAVPETALPISLVLDDRITCRQCAKRVGELCRVKASTTVLDQPRRCRSFEPLPEEQDTRTGRERWMWLQEVDGGCSDATPLGATGAR